MIIIIVTAVETSNLTQLQNCYFNARPVRAVESKEGEMGWNVARWAGKIGYQAF
jgi:hypothetical protein